MRADTIALVLVLALSTGGAWLGARSVDDAPADVEIGEAGAVVDASGVRVPVGDYRRIACVSSVAALILPHLVPAERVVLVPEILRDGSPEAFRTAHATSLPSLAGLEAILAVSPDLVVLNTLGQRSERAQRLLELGIPTLDLGQMTGWDSLGENVATLGAVVGEPERARRYAASLRRRLEQAAIHVPMAERRTAMWLTPAGGAVYGGTEGSSFHDLLRFAGLVDVVAGRADSPWPDFSAEDVLGFDPDLVVTSAGGAQALRDTPGVSDLRAIREGAIVELPPDADTTGPLLVDAVEHLCDAVYGRPPAPVAAESAGSEAR